MKPSSCRLSSIMIFFKTCMINIFYYRILMIVASLGSLLFAFSAEMFFNILPCDFCLYERWVFVVLLGITSADWIFFRSRISCVPALLNGFVLFCGMALTGFHVGMEMKWWKGPASCSGMTIDNSSPMTLDQIHAKLLATPVAKCDQINWSILGVPATVWLFFLLAALLAYTFFHLYLKKKDPLR